MLYPNISYITEKDLDIRKTYYIIIYLYTLRENYNSFKVYIN